MIDAKVNGVSFKSLGLGLIRHDIPVLPPTKDYTIEIAGRDGELDFGVTYGPRTIELECVVMANDTTIDYHNKVAGIARVFNAKRGDQAFTFSDLPGKRYMARYSGTLPIEKILFDGRVTIPLKMVNPWPESDERVTELTITHSPEVTSITSKGDVQAEPIIVLTNTGSNLIRSFRITNEYTI
ncbi:phage tail domain-containing protein [Paenibacillus sp. UMB4589-SE434]|uniref:phage tail domain-containing protein n=1 Tax=Paenibacillus sp. UMB4589-SE434 TaxID=3046314 RepID=UPI00255108E2|nr:phage tail domain-containing protein [Paenibacillus sp. UMB4589-SE434]MDK8182118.1 phage tail family protein [Paenibacillus sp. UMB4589-SE434]